jgi:hypothetical protein
MQFNPSHLDDFQQSFFILDVEVLVGLAFILELERSDVRAETPAGISLKEALFVDSRADWRFGAKSKTLRPRNIRPNRPWSRVRFPKSLDSDE